MPAGNKDLMHLIANGAGGAKEQYGHATGAYAPRTLGKANHDHRDEQSGEEKLYGMGNATDVCAHPHANGSKSPDRTGGAAKSVPPVIPFSVWASPVASAA